MSNPGMNKNLSRLVDMDFILDEMNNHDDYQDGEMNMESPKATNNDNPKKRKADSSQQGPIKKKRFCWDEELHYHFLEFAFRYGIENISYQKLYDTIRPVIDGLRYEFIVNYLSSLRESLDETLQEFATSYEQAVYFQTKGVVQDSTLSKFSTYPFSPHYCEVHKSSLTNNSSQYEQPSLLPSPSPYLQPSIPILPMKIQMNEHQLTNTSQFQQPLPSNPPQQQQSTQTSQYIPLNTLRPSPSSTHDNMTSMWDGCDSLDVLPFIMDQADHDPVMDQQIQLHHDLLRQNDFVLNRTKDNNHYESKYDDNIGLPDLGVFSNSLDPSFPSEFHVSNFLKAPTTSYLQNVDLLLIDQNEHQEYHYQQDDRESDLFDFLK